MQNHKISIIVATKDRKEHLLQFIQSLNRQTVFPDHFIVVDASDNPSKAEIKSSVSCNYDFKYLKSEPGLTKQRNRGVKVSSGDIICFFDDDIVLEEDYLKILKNSFEKHPELGGFSGKTTDVNPKQNCRYYLMQFFYNLCQLSYFDNKGRIRKSFLNNNYHLGENQIYIEFTSGCCMAFTKKALKEVGGFDEKLSNYCYMEDVDISYRVSRKYKILYNPNARCFHNYSLTNRLNDHELGKMLIINQRYLHKKNLPQRLDFRLALFLSFWGLVLSNLLNGNIKSVHGFFSGLASSDKI